MIRGHISAENTKGTELLTKDETAQRPLQNFYCVYNFILVSFFAKSMKNPVKECIQGKWLNLDCHILIVSGHPYSVIRCG